MVAAFILPTARPDLQLRQLVLEDAETLFALIDRNRRHLSQHGDPVARHYVNCARVRESIVGAYPIPARKPLRYGVWYRGALAGSIALGLGHERELGIGEFGYWLGKEFCGRGLATEAVRALARHSFTELCVDKLCAHVHFNNLASQRVLARIGFENLGLDEDERFFRFELATPPTS